LIGALVSDFFYKGITPREWNIENNKPNENHEYVLVMRNRKSQRNFFNQNSEKVSNLRIELQIPRN